MPSREQKQHKNHLYTTTVTFTSRLVTAQKTSVLGPEDCTIQSGHSSIKIQLSGENKYGANTVSSRVYEVQQE